jgi:hypothetical protein
LARCCSTICLPIGKDAYLDLIGDPGRFRAWLDAALGDCPELFPQAFAQGYTLKDARASAKTGLRTRRVRLKRTGQSFSVRPSFVLPYQAALAADVADGLFLRGFGVPFWAIARVFGRDHSYWYRLEVSLGRNSVAGATARRAELPEHLLADEHHQTRGGEKNFIATTVGAGCCLGAALARAADAESLGAAYGVFKQEAQDVRPGYRPSTVNTDGWAGTRQAWLALFPLAALLRCFLHGWLSVRRRGKHLKEVFGGLASRAWAAYRAPSRRGLAQRLRRLREWARRHVDSAVVLREVEALCGRGGEYGEAYRHPGGHRTSSALDRLMRSMSRYFERGQHLHGSAGACELHCRAWALLHNFRPWHPAAARANGGWRSPAERLNKHRYHDDWLQNLLVSASLGGYRCPNRPPHNP